MKRLDLIVLGVLGGGIVFSVGGYVGSLRAPAARTIAPTVHLVRFHGTCVQPVPAWQGNLVTPAAVVQWIGLHPPKVAIGFRVPAAARRYHRDEDFQQCVKVRRVGMVVALSQSVDNVSAIAFLVGVFIALVALVIFIWPHVSRSG